jgi:hypothetical protein
MRKQILAVFLIEVHDELAIAMGAEDMATRLQLSLPLRIVKQLAIDHNCNRTILVEDRLPPIRESEDTEAPVTCTDTRRKQDALIVGTAMC